MTQKELLEYIENNFDTEKIESEGELWWTVFGHGRQSNKEAGTINKSTGYRHVCIRGKAYLVHRIAFLWTHKRFPYDQIDHIDHNKQNNHPSNLREATFSDNNKNKSAQKNNTSGHTGLYRVKRKGIYCGWMGRIGLGQSNKQHSKSFPLTDAGKRGAIKWVKEKRRELGFHKNHGDTIKVETQ